MLVLLRQKYFPREFWRLFNHKNSQLENEAMPDIDTFFNYFQLQNQSNETNQSICDFNIPDEINCNAIPYDCRQLDGDITIDEIRQAVKELKRNEASGLDFIENNHIIDSIDILAPVYAELFNLVLSSGSVPEIWLNGIIKPIFKNKGDPTYPNNYRPITILSW